MKRVLRFTIVMLALFAIASSAPVAQGGAAQKPPDSKPAADAQAKPAADAQKPAQAKPEEPAQELPAEAKAFNAAAGEKNPLKRVEAFEKFLADNPKSTLASMARSQISSSVIAALKEARTKYLALTQTEIEDAKKRTDTVPLYSTYNSMASRLLRESIFSEEAEDFARKGLSAMDERTYTDMRKKQYERSLAAYEKMTSGAKDGKPATPPAAAATQDVAPATPPVAVPATPPAATPATPPAAAPATPPAAAPAPPNYRFSMKDGVMQVSLAAPPPPRPATPRPAPTRPRMPSDEEIRTSFTSERASALATFGQILLKRGKADEGEKALKEAYAAKPASYTMATLARLLSESAKKAGDEKAQVEYLTVLALSGRITTDETKEFEAVYRKSHNGSLDGLETMLDDRFRRENVRFAVTPFTRKPPAKSTGRTVLAEVFTGSG
jgi:tetratricopeptide (TPR) repeat protein